MKSRTMYKLGITARAVALLASTASLVQFCIIAGQLESYRDSGIFVPITALSISIAWGIASLIMLDRVRLRYLLPGDILLALIVLSFGLGEFLVDLSRYLNYPSSDYYFFGDDSYYWISMADSAYALMLLTFIAQVLTTILATLSNRSKTLSRQQQDEFASPENPPSYDQQTYETQLDELSDSRYPQDDKMAWLKMHTSQRSFSSASSLEDDLKKETILASGANKNSKGVFTKL